jgi:membrane-bound lytic murein transglycosylase F
MRPRRLHHTYLILSLSLLLGACSSGKNELEQVKNSGELTVLTRNSGTTYYEGPYGPTGLEYDLAKGFADELGVELKMEVASNVSDVLEQLRDMDADFAAAGLTATRKRQAWARFTPPYQQITQQLVYRIGNNRPENLETLSGTLEITSRSSHEERLRKLKYQFPDLSWKVNKDAKSEELLTMVWENQLDYTIADSNEIAINQRYYPELRVAFNISDPEPLAWAFPRMKDDSLYQAACDYITRIKKSGELAQLIERYYGHLNSFDYVGTVTYLEHIETKLPEYRTVFELAAEEFQLDWRLLAATAYQESHWNPKAVSYTGVRGIMMLTTKTAAEIGVEKRTDPEQSIRGGALYLRRMLDKLPPRVQEPDRSWLALAAYNVGYGHLEDARILTQKRGANPDSWIDVKESLPLLRKRKWYRKTRHGYARGNEPVLYVENIRRYFDLLVRALGQENQDTPVNRALDITSPAL